MDEVVELVDVAIRIEFGFGGSEHEFSDLAWR